MSTDRWQRARGERKEQEEGVGVGRGFGNNVQGCSGVQGEEAESQGSRRGDRSLVRMPGREGGPRSVPLEKARSSWPQPWTCPRRKLKSWRTYRHQAACADRGRGGTRSQAACADCGRGGPRSLETGDGVQLVSQGYQNLEKRTCPCPDCPQKCPLLSLPLSTSVFAAPAGHPEKGRLGELGALGALGARWAAEADVGSSIQRYPDAPSWR